MIKVFAHRDIVDKNVGLEEKLPVFTVINENGEEWHGTDVCIVGSSWMRYNPKAPSGTRVWLETYGPVQLFNGLASLVITITRPRISPDMDLR